MSRQVGSLGRLAEAPRASVSRLVVATLVPLGLAGCGGEAGSLAPASPDARAVDQLMWLMIVLGTIVFVGVIGLFAYAGRGRAARDLADADERSRWLVLGGGVALPVVVLVPLAVFMLVTANRISPNRDAVDEIRVVGHQYWWEVEYPGSVITANEIHLPVGTPVRIVLESADVIHSFWIPELGGKTDMIPGQQTEMILEADAPGRYLGQCAEFCGIQHARMRMVVIAQEREEFDAWLAAQAEPAMPPVGAAAERGSELFAEVGCASCHVVRGTAAGGELGPDLTHVASRTTLAAVTRTNTRDDLAEWIADPQSVKPGALMPPAPVSDADLDDLVAYVEGLR
jgi:cytochrome c oxidase subunit II